MSKDPFQEFVDALDLIRFEMQRLQRTSIDKDEGAALHKALTKAVAQMERAAQEAPRALGSALMADRNQFVSETSEATAEAAERVLQDIRKQLDQERVKFGQAAGAARKEAWRYFGGFWVWLGFIGVTGALLGALTIYGMETAKSLFTVEQMVRYGCGKPWVGGQVVERDDGSSYCAHWMVDPELAKYRRERDQGK